MQGNETFSKIIRTKPQQPRQQQPRHNGKQWERTDKRAPLSLNSQR